MADDFISDEDKALFREHMRFVKPLDKQKPSKVKQPLPTPSSVVVEYSKKQTNPIKNKTRLSKKEYFLSDYISEPVFSESIISYCASSFPVKRFFELKKGIIPWEATLDLHGLTTDAARLALSSFIHTQANKNKGCLLIIHGKGGYAGTPPVIKNLVNRWLPQFDEVLAFHSACAKDGGQGAVYVLLKRHKT